MKFPGNNQGFSVLEVLIAVFIFSALFSAAFSLSFGSQNSMLKSEIYSNLLFNSQLSMEQSRALSMNSFNSLVSSEQVDGDIKKILDVSPLYDFTKNIKSSTEFLEGDFRPVEIDAYVSDWQNSIGANTCFKNLDSIKEFSLISEALSLSVPVTDIDVVRDTAYLTSDSDKDNFILLNVSNKESPFVVGQFSTGYKLNSLHVAGSLAFLATNSSAVQLQILDVYEQENPKIILDFRLPDPSSTTTPSSILYKNKKIYLGTAKHSNGKEFHIIDVSNPENPIYGNSWEIDAKVNDIFVQNNVAFLASVNPFPLRVIDLSDPNSEVIEIFVESMSNTNHSGQTLDVLGELLFLGRSVLNPNQNYNELIVFDVNELLLPKIISTVNLKKSVSTLLARNGLLIFSAAYSKEKEIKFFDNSDPEKLKSLYSLPLDTKIVALDCEDNFLFAVTESPVKLLIIEMK